MHDSLAGYAVPEGSEGTQQGAIPSRGGEQPQQWPASTIIAPSQALVFSPLTSRRYSVVDLSDRHLKNGSATGLHSEGMKGK